MVRVVVKHVTKALREHHDNILVALQLLYKALEVKDAEAIYKLIKFAQGFVDACHHSVEEYVLFFGAVRGGFPFEGGPIQVMVCEHGTGRYLARAMEELYKAWKAGDEKALTELIDVARLYVDHLAQHIDKENNVLFPMLEAHVQAVESNRSVEEIEKENNHEEWIKLLDRLRKRLEPSR